MKVAVHLAISTLLTVVALPAFAVYSQQVVLTGGPELASAQISFTAADGQAVTVTTEEDEDRRIAYLAFGGNSGSAGTLNVTTAGQTQAYPLPAASSGQVINVNTATGVVLLGALPAELEPARPATAQRSGPTLSAFYGLGVTEVPAIGSAALLSTDDGDSFLSESDEELDINMYGVEATIPIGETGLRAHVVWSSYSGDDDTHAESVPVIGGGVDNALVAQQESPTYGTGLFGGPTPITTEGRIELDGDKYGASLSFPCSRIEHVTGTLGIYYGTSDLDHEQFDSFTAPVSSRRSANVSQDSWFVSLGGEYAYPFNDHVAATLSAGAVFQFYDAEMKSTQQISFFTNPVETLETTDDDDDFAIGGYISAGLPISFGSVTITPTVFFETGTVTAALQYPESGDAVLAGDRVSLDNDTVTNWIGTINLSLRF